MKKGIRVRIRQHFCRHRWRWTGIEFRLDRRGNLSYVRCEKCGKMLPYYH